MLKVLSRFKFPRLKGLVSRAIGKFQQKPIDQLEVLTAQLRNPLRSKRREAVLKLADLGKRERSSQVFYVLIEAALNENYFVRRAALLSIADISPRLNTELRREAKQIISRALCSSDKRVEKTARVARYYLENPSAARKAAVLAQEFP
ncbi:MAG: hypothetical protein COT15_04935 [Candidatus Diapherotrites archaeon CG08_land_8_20_14_0_20_34_12]|nr:MAG: hypothetical protein COT15_04935 [Candidatus Diapherotrites archaeon CG08_land_8_20_14_0_20_34_12]